MSIQLAQDYLRYSAAAFPDQPAVRDDTVSLTFRELDEQSDALAALLRTLGVGRDDRVIYYLPRGVACIVATAAILKSGAAYIPLDKKTPPERWKRIVTDSSPAVILCAADTLPAARDSLRDTQIKTKLVCLTTGTEKQPGVVYFEDRAARLASCPAQHPDDVAYILYTSGSTGTPKGVMVTHRNITNYIDWAMAYFKISFRDRILGTAPFYFDMSTFDIFCAWAAGAPLCIASEATLLFPEKLARYIEQEEVTLWKGVSSLLMYLCRGGAVKAGRMPSLRTVIFAGEPLGAQYLAHWMQSFPEKSFYNGYGPTEATGVSLCYHVVQIPKPGQPIPIGKPCKGAQAFALDENDRIVPAGAIGELCIAGECLAKGYFNDPQKTHERFTPPPPGVEVTGGRIYRTGDLVRQDENGDYIFISRKDYQVKWMGYRIELGEIETHLMAHPQVRDAVVLLASAGDAALTELTAFFEADMPLASGDLCKFLETRVPPYMIPRHFVQMPALPRNDRGKIARDVILDAYVAMKRQPHG
ncbi:MAG: amino acid adenylation domain-containing protein [Anaerolineales bacterium]